MQIIESTVYGVRSAIWTFEKDDEHPAIILFPMLHIAERSFYEEVSSRLKICDVILYEGVRSRTGHWISSAYLQMIKNPEHGLVSQKEMPLEHVKDRLVHADVDGQKLDEKWGELSFFNRFLLPVLSPLAGYYLRWFGSRKLLARYMKTELQKDREEFLVDDDTIERDKLILDWRDESLIQAIDVQIEKLAQNNNTRIGIVYGAGHMRAVIRHLVSHQQYRPDGSEWLMVFSL